MLAVVTGCTSLGPSIPASSLQRETPATIVESVAIDPASAELAAFYAHIEGDRVSRTLMRRDDGAVPLDAARLAQTYAEVALRNEDIRGGSPAVLRRWQAPVRYALEFGASTPVAKRRQDHAQVVALAARLAEAARHPISVAPLGVTEGNFHVLVLSENERLGVAPRLRALVPGIDEATLRLITEMPRETFCLVIAFSRDGSAVYSEAVAVIRAEHPDLTRLACYHEELTQGLGLAADSPRARPSIFNDDQEFALLTVQDLALLRLHYDPRLSPGMTEQRARPVIFSIATELAASDS